WRSIPRRPHPKRGDGGPPRSALLVDRCHVTFVGRSLSSTSAARRRDRGRIAQRRGRWACGAVALVVFWFGHRVRAVAPNMAARLLGFTRISDSCHGLRVG